MMNAAVSDVEARAGPPVAELLDVDREFRMMPSRLAFFHTSRGDRHYTALYSQSPLARRMGRTFDWVVVDLEVQGANPRWTIVTERRGVLKGKRVVRGREVECFAHYRFSRGGHHAAA